MTTALNDMVGDNGTAPQDGKPGGTALDSISNQGVPDAKADLNNTPTTNEPPAGDDAPVTNDPPSGDPKPSGDTNDSTPAPSDWATIRTKVANGDEKILNRLSRYSTLEEALRAGVEAQNKIGSMKKQPTLSADSTPEEIAEYRKVNGIPDSPDGYEINLGDGLVLGEADRPVADEFLRVAHEHNLPPKAVNAIIARHLQLQDQAIKAQEEQDINDRTATTAALTSADMWGSEARLNATIVHGMLEQAPPGIRDGLLQSRLPNGKLLGNDVEAMQWLASQARAINPYATVTPAPGLDAAGTVDAEIAAIEAKMGTPEYYKNEAMQARYRDLITLRDKNRSVNRR